MSAYVVSYDLRKPGRNYQLLWDRLREWGGVRVLESVWAIDANPRATVIIRDDLKNYIDSNDGILVAGPNGELAWDNLIDGSGQFLLKRFAA